jgi:hypothetical protein
MATIDHPNPKVISAAQELRGQAFQEQLEASLATALTAYQGEYMLRGAALLVFLGASLLTGACATPAPQYEKQNNQEDVGKAQQAVGGEDGCATVAITSNSIGASVAAPPSAGTVNAFSPDDRYDSSSCPRQWVFEVTGWSNVLILPRMQPDPLPTDATECANTYYQVNYYGLSGWGWSSVMYTETWEGGWSGSSCSMYRVSSSGNYNIFFYPNFFSTVRAAMQAWTWLANGTRVDYKLVDASITKPPM